MRTPLSSLSFAKYERILPRVFPDAVFFELCDRQGSRLWALGADPVDTDSNPIPVVWSELDKIMQRRSIPDTQLQFRAQLQMRQYGPVGWLIVGFDAQESVPLSTATSSLQKAFLDASAILQDELQLQSECDALAVELTERYEELNLVYATQDQVEGFEEGHAALEQLVHNCCDYLDVGLAVLICRDRGLVLTRINRGHAPDDTDGLIRYLETNIYDHVQAQVSSIVVNEEAEAGRSRLLGGRSENVLATPVVDDHGGVIGLLGVASAHDQHTFSNGDRNLLEVMAKKASRIIHTHHDSLTGLLNRNRQCSAAPARALANAATISASKPLRFSSPVSES